MIKKDSLFAVEGMTRSDRCLHTPSDFARRNLLYVQEVGRLQSLEVHRCIRENLESYLFLVVLEGKGSLEVGGNHYDIKAGDCAFIDCMTHYEHISDEKDAWKLAWVHFDGQAARGYYELFMKYNGDKNVFTARETAFWNDIIGKLMEEQKDRNLSAELRCGEVLLHLVNNVIDSVFHVSAAESEQTKQMAGELREMLNQQYADAEVLKEAETAFGEKASELADVFLKQFGISMEEYVSSRRLNAAKELLRFSIKPLEEVAEESGIADLAVMQEMFKEKEGMSAEEYRARWAQWIR